MSLLCGPLKSAGRSPRTTIVRDVGDAVRTQRSGGQPEYEPILAACNRLAQLSLYLYIPAADTLRQWRETCAQHFRHSLREALYCVCVSLVIIIFFLFFLFKPAISLLEQLKVIIFPPSVSRVARSVHGYQAIVFLQLHISTVDREVHHSKHKTTPFIFEAGRPGGRVVRTHCAYECSCARARKRACAWTAHTVNVHVYVCA